VRQPRVFISYTHDGAEHSRRILRLAERLRGDGHDARIDQFVNATPEGGWPAWMEREIDEADFVLVVCTPNYHERYRQEGDHSVGLGGRWESSLIRNSLYGDERELARFIPILTKQSAPDDIPLRLRYSATFHRLDDYDEIVEHIRSAFDPQRDSADSAFGHSTQGVDFAPDIKALYATLGRVVERLTREQYQVITRLHGTKRALISGAPGSGKTLVAAEKARRLDEAGIETLFVCHNPLLADWVRQMLRSTKVHVLAFEDLVRRLAADLGEPLQWSAYSSPTSEQLELALAALESGGPPYAAVIVDEGQDFAAEWWSVVQGCVEVNETLYVFYGDQQTLLKDRMHLPPLGWPSTLSRNCRNAGRVYDAMRRLAPLRQLPEQELEKLGHVGFFARASITESLQAALAWLHDLRALDGAAAVLGGALDFDSSALARGPFEIAEQFQWRDAVSQQLTRIARQWTAQLRLPDLGVEDRLGQLSQAWMPTERDRDLVAQFATELLRSYPGSRPGPVTRARWRPVADAQRIPGVSEWRLKPSGASSVSGVEVLEALRSGAWADALSPPAMVSFARHEQATTEQLPVYLVGEIKGLERDCVLLVLQGDAPQWSHELFVGVSRARSVLAVVLESHAASALPPKLQSCML
jgi:hypothetical protein